MAQSVSFVEVSRVSPRCVIGFRSDKFPLSIFGEVDMKRSSFEVEARMRGHIFVDVSEALAAGVSEPVIKPF